MAGRLLESLGPEKALIFRIVHRDNIPMLFQHGLLCSGSSPTDSGYTRIGSEALVAKRPLVQVPVEPGGCLADYIPFYFTPYSPMLFNIKTGLNVEQRNNDEIVILVSSLMELQRNNVQFVFTDRHAYLKAARFENDLSRLDSIAWELFRARDFRRDPEQPDKVERYQAEALAYRYVPISAIFWVGCYNRSVREFVDAQARTLGLTLKVVTRPEWYF